MRCLSNLSSILKFLTLYSFTCISQMLVRYLPKWSKPRYLKTEALQVPQKVRTVLFWYLLPGIRILVSLCTGCGCESRINFLIPWTKIRKTFSFHESLSAKYNYFKIISASDICLFYWFLILIDLNRLVYSWVFAFFSFTLLINYLKKILLYDSLVPTLNNFFLFSCYKPDICMFFQIFQNLFKNVFAFFLTSMFM